MAECPCRDAVGLEKAASVAVDEVPVLAEKDSEKAISKAAGNTVSRLSCAIWDIWRIGILDPHRKEKGFVVRPE